MLNYLSYILFERKINLKAKTTISIKFIKEYNLYEKKFNIKIC